MKAIDIETKERARRNSKRWYEANKEKAKQRALQWRKDHPEKVEKLLKKSYEKNKEKYRENRYKRKFGINMEVYKIKFEKQKGLCEICNKPSSLNLAVDHCHKTGKIRDLLCTACNRALGLFKEDKISLLKAIEYLTKWENL